MRVKRLVSLFSRTRGCAAENGQGTHWFSYLLRGRRPSAGISAAVTACKQDCRVGGAVQLQERQSPALHQQILFGKGTIGLFLFQNEQTGAQALSEGCLV